MKMKDHSSVRLSTGSLTPTKYRNKITNERYEGGADDAGITFIDGIKFRRVFPVSVGQRPLLIRDDVLERISDG